MHNFGEYRRQFESLWRDARSRYPRLAVGAIFAFAFLVTFAVGSGAWFLLSIERGLPAETEIARIGEMDQATAVFDHNDKPAFTIFKEQRIEVPLSEMSPHLIDALIATEDQRFRDHKGFDLVRIASAAMANLRSGRVAQGGSTITQQLARQAFLTSEKTIRRKIQELILASRIERAYTKDNILELYFNKVYFGDGLYGAEAASRGYFGKHASELSVPEAALLAGLVKSPSSYAPTVSLERAIARRNVVLQAMLDNGAIDRPAFEKARASAPALHDELRQEEPYGQYFKELVRQELVERFGWERVYQGGLRVFTTIDLNMQKAAETAVSNGLKSIEAKRRVLAERRKKAGRPNTGSESNEPLQGALVAMDPQTGHIRAMVGGRNFGESPFNRAVHAERQPGSAFKPFVYAAALESGFTPASMIENLDTPIATVQGAWTPEDEHSTAPALSLRSALRMSSNRAAVQLLQQVGIGRTVQYAKNMGVGNMPSVPSLALGSGEVTLQSMTAAYATFANRGRVPRPLAIRRVEDIDGRVLYLAQNMASYAISEITAFQMTTMMADVINAGTGSPARALGFKLPAAGKTGTTNDFHDAWFVGFTPKLATGVWVGFDQPQTILPNGFSASTAVPVWAEFMKAATSGDKPEWFTPPRGLITRRVCRLSGKLAADGCENVEVIARDGQVNHRSMVYTEYFAVGTEPTSTCALHPTRGFFGAIASMLGAHTSAPPAVAASDAGLPPPQQPAAVEAPTPPLQDPEIAIAPTAEEAKPRRGFWSRIFGIGGNKDKDKEQK
jgi:1A family penicillin-binding protein